MCFSLLLLPQGANPIVRVSSFFLPTGYTFLGVILLSKECVVFFQEEGEFSISNCFGVRKKSTFLIIWDSCWLLLFLQKTSRGKKQKGKPCSITPLVHACHCHWLGGWRNIWLPGKINERTKFKLIKQIRGWLYKGLGNCLDISWWVSGVVSSLWTAQWVSKGHHWIALE